MNAKKNSSGSLSLFALVTIGIGTAIGSGIVSVVGQAVAVTGTSAWVAIFITCLLGMLICAAPAFMCSMMRVDGGNYGFAAMALGDYWAGVIGLSSISSVFSMSMFGTSFGLYINALIPSISVSAAGVFIMTVFFILNLCGIDIMAKVQNIMTVCLIGGLLVFIVFGAVNLDPAGTGVFSISSPSFFANGLNGIMSAIMMMIMATTGMRFLVNFSRDAIYPKRDIPIAMLITCIIVTLLYTGIAIVECGVLPINQVAGQTLSVLAQKLMPAPLYVVFMIGGPIMALTTTINSSFPVTVEPIRRAAADGFLPAICGKRNRFGSPYFLMLVCYLFAVTPLLIGINFQVLISAAMAGSSLMQAIVWYCYFKGPRKVPEAWDKRYYKIPRLVYDIFCIAAMIIWFIMWIIAVKDTDPGMLVIALLFYVCIFLIPYIAKKRGTVKVENAFDITVDM